MSNTLTIIVNGKTIYDGVTISGSWEHNANGRFTLDAQTPPAEYDDWGNAIPSA